MSRSTRPLLKSVCFRMNVEDAEALRSLADRMPDADVSDLIRTGIKAVVNVERLVDETPTMKMIRNVLGLNAGKGDAS